MIKNQIFKLRNLPGASRKSESVRVAGGKKSKDFVACMSGLRHIDMPATPRRVWEMLNGI
jgi:hypothetical protein